MRDLAPFLMFCGEQHWRAGEAIAFYCSTFPDSRIVQIDRYGPEEAEPERTVRVATFELGGKRLMAIDSAAPHEFTFTPAISIWIERSSADEIERLSSALLDGGSALMPLGDYGFSRQSCWVADRYGVTWQLNLAS
ncbi:MAG TPA: VOC family protein [Dehalococcoidia bacterium]|nr:VOC family protein [Dehalococcoidia bacterium]